MLSADVRSDLEDSRILRRTMVDCQVRTFDVTDQRLIARLLEVPRERFVPDAMRHLAYSDVALRSSGEGDDGESRDLLPPMILARLIQGGRVRPVDRVLDVAPGTGYSTAVLAGLAAEVVALEDTTARRTDLEARLAAFGLGRLQVIARGLDRGVPESGPYDVILVNCAVEVGLDVLFEQLADGGRLVAIERGPLDPTGRAAKAMCFEKRGQAIGHRYLFDASAIVPAVFRRARTFTF